MRRLPTAMTSVVLLLRRSVGQRTGGWARIDP
jgi:hypothetical protein